MALQAAVSPIQLGTGQLPRKPTSSLCADLPGAAHVHVKKSMGWSGQTLQQKNFAGFGGKPTQGIRVQRQSGFAVRAGVGTVAPALGEVTEVDKDSFWSAVDAAGDKVVVLDMYTQWCGPCKIIAPKVQELSEKYSDVVFLKLDCNLENKPLAKELGVRVVPTFKVLKDKKIIKEVEGAKFHDLVQAIESVKASAQVTN